MSKAALKIIKTYGRGRISIALLLDSMPGSTGDMRTSYRNRGKSQCNDRETFCAAIGRRLCSLSART
jgi:hypothetical protein